jgi:homeobox protein cut-like
VEFGGMDLDDMDTDADAEGEETLQLPDPNADKANRQRGKPLESLLLAKNRKTQDELTGLRVRCVLLFIFDLYQGSYNFPLF